jgi:hypothetical protein
VWTAFGDKIFTALAYEDAYKVTEFLLIQLGLEITFGAEL